VQRKHTRLYVFKIGMCVYIPGPCVPVLIDVRVHVHMCVFVYAHVYTCTCVHAFLHIQIRHFQCENEKCAVVCILQHALL